MRIFFVPAVVLLLSSLAPGTGAALTFPQQLGDVRAANPAVHTISVAAIKCRARNFPRLTVIENKVLAFKTRSPTGTRLPPNLAFNQRSIQRRVARCVERERLRTHRQRFKY